jgi:hypothetical protein
MTILGDPDNMEIDGKRRMGAMAIVTHVPQPTKIGSSCRLKVGVLSLPIGEKKGIV